MKQPPTVAYVIEPENFLLVTEWDDTPFYIGWKIRRDSGQYVLSTMNAIRSARP